MTLILDTYKPTANNKKCCKEFYTTYSAKPDPYLLMNYNIEVESESVFVVFSGDKDIVTEFNNDKLTLLASELSETSFNELWKDEDDNYWDSYL